MAVSAEDAHEINNLLVYVILGLELIEREAGAGCDRERIRALCKDALEGAEKVRSLVRDVRGAPPAVPRSGIGMFCFGIRPGPITSGSFPFDTPPELPPSLLLHPTAASSSPSTTAASGRRKRRTPGRVVRSGRSCGRFRFGPVILTRPGWRLHQRCQGAKASPPG